MSLIRCTATTSLVLAGLALSAPAQTLVKDIDATLPTELGGSEPADFTFADGVTYFTALGAGTGRELFASDGTPGGSGLVVDLLEGALSSEPTALTPFGSDVFFIATSSSTSGAFRSDGTAGGTALLLSGAEDVGSDGANLYLLDVAGGASTIYVSDGTVSGTSALFAGTNTKTQLVGEMNGWFFFIGDGDQLWRTDGTIGGTELVIETTIIGEHSMANGTLWFVLFANSGTPKWKLWKSDGTAAGTSVVKTLDFKPALLTAGANGCIFTRLIGPNVEPWISDGTGAGTFELATLSASFEGSFPEEFTPFGGGFVFSAVGSGIGRELYITDGTTAGTQLLIDLAVGIVNSNPEHMTEHAGEIYFKAGASSTNHELWKTDGTAAGTSMVADLKSNGDSDPSELASDGVNLWFSAYADGVGREPFVTDGSTTALIANLEPNAATDSSTIEFLADLNGTAIFLANDGVHGDELWASRGSAGTTRMLADISPGGGQPGSVSVSAHAIFDGLLYLNVSANSTGMLWATDGTPGGTFEVTPGMPSYQLAVSNGKLYFAADDPDREPWILNSKFETPQKLADLHPGDSYAGSFYPVGDLTVFSAEAPGLGRELYVTDGTEAGTQVLADLNPGPDDSFPKNFTTFNGEVYFIARTGSSQRIWSTDGTPAGTVLRVDPLVEFGSGGSPVGLTPAAGLLYFTAGGSAFAFDPVANSSIDLLLSGVDGFDTFFPIGDEVLILDDDDEFLYRYTGTPGVFDVLVQGTGFPLNLRVETAGELAFVQRDNELLTTDGTPGGTVLVEPLVPFSMSQYGYPETDLHPTQVGSDARVLVQGYDPVAGRELWISDGTAAGTGPLLDVDGTPADSSPSQFFRAGDLVFFTADDGIHGRELHAIPFAATGGYVAENFGTVCPMTTGETPTMSSTGAPRVGSAGFTVDYDGAPAGSAALLFYSPAQTVAPLGGGCALYFGAPYFLYPGSALTDVAGHGTLPVPVPNDPFLAGLTLAFQYLVSDPGGVLFGAVAPTDGLEVVLGP